MRSGSDKCRKVLHLSFDSKVNIIRSDRDHHTMNFFTHQEIDTPDDEIIDYYDYSSNDKWKVFKQFPNVNKATIKNLIYNNSDIFKDSKDLADSLSKIYLDNGVGSFHMEFKSLHNKTFDQHEFLKLVLLGYILNDLKCHKEFVFGVYKRSIDNRIYGYSLQRYDEKSKVLNYATQKVNYYSHLDLVNVIDDYLLSLHLEWSDIYNFIKDTVTPMVAKSSSIQDVTMRIIDPIIAPSATTIELTATSNQTSSWWDLAKSLCVDVTTGKKITESQRKGRLNRSIKVKTVRIPNRKLLILLRK